VADVVEPATLVLLAQLPHGHPREAAIADRKKLARMLLAIRSTVTIAPAS